jgi:Uncharacterized protein conserved in bacteria
VTPAQKQRVVGIIVLITLISLLVPLLFEKENPEVNQTIPFPQTTLIKPVENDGSLSNKTGTVASEELPVVHEMEAYTEAKITTDTDDSIIESQAALTTNEPILSEDPISAATTTLPETSSKATKVAVSEPLHSTSKPDNPAADENHISYNSAGSSKTTQKHWWSVQVGSFYQTSYAKNLVAKLQAAGFDAYQEKGLNKSKNRPMVRVLVGHCKDLADAKKLATKIKNGLDIDGYVVKMSK